MLLCINRHAFEDSSVWYGAKSSEWVEQTITLHGQLFHERQYAVLNMSGPSHSANSNLTYADSCNDRELGFVCIDLHGKFLLLNIR